MLLSKLIDYKRLITDPQPDNSLIYTNLTTYAIAEVWSGRFTCKKVEQKCSVFWASLNEMSSLIFCNKHEHYFNCLFLFIVSTVMFKRSTSLLCLRSVWLRPFSACGLKNNRFLTSEVVNTNIKTNASFSCVVKRGVRGVPVIMTEVIHVIQIITKTCLYNLTP